MSRIMHISLSQLAVISFFASSFFASVEAQTLKRFERADFAREQKMVPKSN